MDYHPAEVVRGQSHTVERQARRTEPPQKPLHALYAERSGHGNFISYHARFGHEAVSSLDKARCACGTLMKPNHMPSARCPGGWHSRLRPTKQNPGLSANPGDNGNYEGGPSSTYGGGTPTSPLLIMSSSERQFRRLKKHHEALGRSSKVSGHCERTTLLKVGSCILTFFLLPLRVFLHQQSSEKHAPLPAHVC